MSMTTQQASETRFVREPGPWLTFRSPQTELASHSAEQMLQETQRLVTPLRLGRCAAGVFLFGEAPLSSGENSQREACAAMKQWLRGQAVTRKTLDAEEVEAALADSGRGWTRREADWIVPLDTSVPVEVHVQCIPRGRRIAGELCSGEDPFAPIARQALAEFLCRAQPALRFARLEMDETVRVVTEVNARLLDSHFSHGLESVAQACRALAAEVRALTNPELAGSYLLLVSGGLFP
jgi:hypothetical protein